MTNKEVITYFNKMYSRALQEKEEHLRIAIAGWEYQEYLDNNGWETIEQEPDYDKIVLERTDPTKYEYYHNHEEYFNDLSHSDLDENIEAFKEYLEEINNTVSEYEYPNSFNNYIGTAAVMPNYTPQYSLQEPSILEKNKEQVKNNISIFTINRGKLKIEILDTIPNPTVVIPANTAAKINYIVDRCALEVGWMCTVTRENNIFTLGNVYVPEQKVHSATTEISSEGLGKLTTSLLKEKKIDDINNMKCWSHSHCSMPTNPSGQDHNQFLDLYAEISDFFLMIICNKERHMYVEIADIQRGIKYINPIIRYSPYHNSELTLQSFEDIELQLKNNVKHINTITIKKGNKNGSSIKTGLTRNGSKGKRGKSGRTTSKKSKKSTRNIKQNSNTITA